ncbi:putative pyridoxal phosphate-dependent acyltransferase [bioreactor metagenome]|uniref:8-amino-7-oxononanoate synthase n=1 Tax=bioreactor metagenome TaxID=1076179 RepID=A0A644Z593_9ZZZZ
MKENMQFLLDTMEDLKSTGLYNNIRTIESAQGAWIQVDGKKALNLCSNNYLGLANHPRMVQAAKDAIDAYGVGPAAVRSIAGTQSIHVQLDQEVAKFKKVEAALTLQGGFVANQAVISPLVGKADTIVSDELNHASIIDGARLSGAKIKVYRHNDMAHLEEVLQGENAGRVLVITDGVFSMDGDVANLPKIVELCEKYGAMSMVDDAHGEGVLGTGGRGIVDHFGLHGRCDIEIGTFSKAIGTVGGFIAGSAVLIQYLKQKARPFLFSSALPAADVAATLEAIRILSESTELVDRLWENGRFFKAGMKKLGFDTGVSETPITPVMLGEADVARKFSAKLFERGIFAMAIGFPTVPRGKARIRVMISAAHQKTDLEFALAQFEIVGKEMGLI